MDATVIVAILGAGGIATVLPLLINATKQLVSGAAHRERLRNTSLQTQAAKAIEAKEKSDALVEVERSKRFEAEEHISILQKQVRDLGRVPLERGDGTSK